MSVPNNLVTDCAAISAENARLKWAIDQIGLKPIESRLLVSMVRHCDENGIITASQAVLAERIEAVPRSIVSALVALKAKGLISRKSGVSGGRGKGRAPDIIVIEYHSANIAECNQNSEINASCKSAESQGPEVSPQTLHDAKTGAANPPYDINNSTPRKLAADEAGEAALPQNQIRVWADRLYAVAGPGLGDPDKFASLRLTEGELASWARAGADLELDAVPVIAAKTAKARQSPIRTWGLFREDVLASAARRSAVHTLPEIPANDLTKPRQGYGAYAGQAGRASSGANGSNPGGHAGAFQRFADREARRADAGGAGDENGADFAYA